VLSEVIEKESLICEGRVALSAGPQASVTHMEFPDMLLKGGCVGEMVITAGNGARQVDLRLELKLDLRLDLRLVLDWVVLDWVVLGRNDIVESGREKNS
jgi:hypothetical protein